MTGIHQFVPVLLRNDAVGEHTLAVRDLLRRAGFESRIYSETPVAATRDEARPFREYEADARPGDVLVYQFATRSGIADWLLGRPEPLVVNYHSVTPPDSFASWNNGSARLQVACLDELARLAPRAVLGIAVSEFDGRELRAAGCAATTVIPVVTVPGDPVPADEGFAARLRGPWPAVAGAGDAAPGARWLSVGRLAPNKAHQDAVAALFLERMTGDPDARLVIVGSVSERNYAGALRRYVSWLGLDRAVRFLTGLTAGELSACYQAADVLVMLSDHEGFGVPLVEAMHHGLPVVAYAAGAVPEVLGEAGLLLADKSPGHVATEVHRVLGDPELRARLASAVPGQLARLDVASAAEALVGALRGVAGARPVVGTP